MADTFKEFQGVWGCNPQKLQDFCNLRALKYPKIDAKNIKMLKLIMPIYVVQTQ